MTENNNNFLPKEKQDQAIKWLNDNGITHTNTIESFWAIVKRGMMGQFHWVSKKYLEKYMDEFCWRFNNKENPAMFSNLISNCVA